MLPAMFTNDRYIRCLRHTGLSILAQFIFCLLVLHDHSTVRVLHLLVLHLVWVTPPTWEDCHGPEAAISLDRCQIWPLRPSGLRNNFCANAASGVKRVKYILQTGELPGPVWSFCPCTSLPSVICEVLVLVHMLWSFSIMFYSWSLEFTLSVVVAVLMLSWPFIVL